MKKDINLDKVKINGEDFFRITHVDQMPPFFMTIVSDSDHWLFLASNGGITAGRKNSEYALFPYYTDDKITESTEFTGSKTILQVFVNDRVEIWEPFSIREEGKYHIVRNLYKNSLGNKIIFEEINHTLNLTYSYEWNNTDKYGFVKKSKLKNHSFEIVKIKVLDGLQNILPYGIGSELQMRVSNLGDAYKRTELEENSGLGIFALSAIIVDKAEPSEALKANVVFSLGLVNPRYLLSSQQLKQFRQGLDITQETDIKGSRGAYFIVEELAIDSNGEKEWLFVANVNQSQSQVVALIETVKNTLDLKTEIQKDINLGSENLSKLVASADGFMFTEDSYKDSRHFSNVLFNIMRGGVFDDGYSISKSDFVGYLEKANKTVLTTEANLVERLPELFSLFDLKEITKTSENKDFVRLATEYLPLKFSRRHGDPSRPWNKFSINTKNEADGSKILDYEGNWRDIFQNWEALAHAYPYFIKGMIFRFLNATTFDGYNPYRVTKGGFDWETIEADDPWSYIGYWGDHQIIYLLKFLEFAEDYFPGELEELLNQDVFVYANVPYKIKPYTAILENSKDTIDFDFQLDEHIREKRQTYGADGALLPDENGQLVYVNFTEKILATVLAKLSNFIVEGGIWMNTQRPEWNDANNALVGNGVSMVTLYYLRRFMKFFQSVLEKSDLETVKVSNEVVDFYKKVRQTFEDNIQLLESTFTDADRKAILDALGSAASDFRTHIYEKGFWGKKRSISLDGLKRFTHLTLTFLEHSIKKNLREDGLYHAYNLMSATDTEVNVTHLSEMLEGQVAVLSSGFLSSTEALSVLDSLKKSALFREDQYSYILYPNKNLKGFLERNTIPKEEVESKMFFPKLKQSNILEQDVLGNYHFNGNFKNANDLNQNLKDNPLFNKEEKEALLSLFEEVFDHKAFTGRSGTFYGYEGLGSIYWHMVSKLLLAVQEVCLKAINDEESPEIVGRLLEHFYEINEGIGTHKSPELYGAFPTDAYSHTPFSKGAQQPGMTGQVKEDILSRMGELGIMVKNGEINFLPNLLRKEEFLSQEAEAIYFDVAQKEQKLNLSENHLFFTKCQTPVLYEIAEEEGIVVFYSSEDKVCQKELVLNVQDTEHILKRDREIELVKVFIKKDRLR